MIDILRHFCGKTTMFCAVCRISISSFFFYAFTLWISLANEVQVTASSDDKMLDAIVIGCGASGIAALTKLHQAGLKVIGLEAADRIGGRIHTVDFGASTVDLGAEWCEGDRDNIVYDLAYPYGLLEWNDRRTKHYVLSNGDLVPNDIAAPIVKGLSSTVLSADKTGSLSVLDVIEIAENSSEILQRDPYLTKSFVEWYERTNQVGGQVDRKEALSLRVFSGGQRMLHWKQGGYRNILDILLNRHPDPSKDIPVQIYLNKEVTNINWRPNQANDAHVLVTCKNGTEYKSKSVIVTSSVEVLRERHEQLFSPALPVEKVNLINNLRLCTLGKIFIEFAAPWWPETSGSFNILWRDEDKEKFVGNNEWITEIYALNTVSNQPNVLIAWTYGRGAIAMERTELEHIEAGIKKLLDFTLKRHYNVTQIKSIVRTQWGTNPFIKGSFAYRTIAFEESGDDAATLKEPLNHEDGSPAVMFAGDATALDHGAVHGAIQSGFREADRLIKSLRV